MDLSLGIWQPSELELHMERDALMRSEYYDPIERFPEKIDQLLEALNRVRFNFLMMKIKLDQFLLFRSISISKSKHQSKTYQQSQRFLLIVVVVFNRPNLKSLLAN
jgi:hypothetical protein